MSVGSMTKQLEQVQKFLANWLTEGGPNDSLAPSRVVSLWGLSLPGGLRGTWGQMQAIEDAIEDWAIELGVGTGVVDEAHPDAPWGDNLVRKLMIIRGRA